MLHALILLGVWQRLTGALRVDVDMLFAYGSVALLIALVVWGHRGPGTKGGGGGHVR